MKKTLTVNLNGTVFNIDEDAYQLLDTYLSNLRAHYSREDATGEIMSDFEARISELLNDRIRLGCNVITIEHVEEVIKRMGKPEDLFSQDGQKSSEDKKSTNSSSFQSGGKAKKRLMRDPDSKVLGGVSSGLAHFFGIDITIMRLIMLLLLFFGNVPIVFIYIILWLAIPLARTASDKLIMRGESVNLENIGKTVSSDFDKTQVDFEKEPRTTLQKIGDFIVSFFGVLLKICAVILGIVLLPVLLVVLVVLFAVLIGLLIAGFSLLFGVGTFSITTANLPVICNIPVAMQVISSITGILFFGIPLVGLLYWLGQSLFKFKPMASSVKITLIILWVISLIAASIIVPFLINNYNLLHIFS